MKCFQTNLVDDIHIFAAFLRKNALPRRTFCSFWWKTHLYNATTKEEEEKIARANAKREMQRNTRTETLFVRVIPSSFLYRSRVHHRQQSLFLLSLSRSFHFTRNKKKSRTTKATYPVPASARKRPSAYPTSTISARLSASSVSSDLEP